MLTRVGSSGLHLSQVSEDSVCVSPWTAERHTSVSASELKLEATESDATWKQFVLLPSDSAQTCESERSENEYTHARKSSLHLFLLPLPSSSLLIVLLSPPLSAVLHSARFEGRKFALLHKHEQQQQQAGDEVIHSREKGEGGRAEEFDTSLPFTSGWLLLLPWSDLCRLAASHWASGGSWILWWIWGLLWSSLRSYSWLTVSLLYCGANWILKAEQASQSVCLCCNCVVDAQGHKINSSLCKVVRKVRPLTLLSSDKLWWWATIESLELRCGAVVWTTCCSPWGWMNTRFHANKHQVKREDDCDQCITLQHWTV